jgi:16S rRNA (cytosine1402-N4)-methyltransferase
MRRSRRDPQAQLHPEFKGAREAGEAELASNPRARSAKLRAAVRTDAAPWGRIAA